MYPPPIDFVGLDSWRTSRFQIWFEEREVLFVELEVLLQKSYRFEDWEGIVG